MLRTTFTSTTTLVSLIMLAATASCAGVRGTEKERKENIVEAPDCLIEEMKRTEGYVPSGVCAHGRPRTVGR